MSKAIKHTAVTIKIGEHISKDNVKPQDLTYFMEKLDRVKKMLRKHPGKNRDFDPEVKTNMMARWEHDDLDPNDFTSSTSSV